MRIHHKAVISAMAVVTALSVNLLCRAAAGSPTPTKPTTMPTGKSPELFQTDLALVQGILESKQQATGVTAIGGEMDMFLSKTDLFDQKPPAITKEPVYVGKRKYGAFVVGNGPKSITYFAVDDAPGAAGKIYVDRNQNGDLTDDGNSAWDNTFVRHGATNRNTTITLHASWGSPLREKESGDYSFDVAFYDGAKGVAFSRTTGRVGSIKLGDKQYPIVLGESMGDGIFTVAADGDLTRKAVMLYIDIDGAVPADAPAPKVDPTNKHEFVHFETAHQHKIDGHWYMFRPSISGSHLIAQETTPPDEARKLPETPKLSEGDTAPAFTVQTPDGKPLSLSDFKGKVVILDYWATWCGPCQASMPDLEKLYQQVKDQGVVVLSINVNDQKAPFDRWIAAHANKDYHFNFGFDPAGKGPDGLATSKYFVMALPSQFVITRDGKIAGDFTGFDGTETQLIKALKAQGVAIHAD